MPPQTTHGGTLCSWVGWSIYLFYLFIFVFWGGGRLTENWSDFLQYAFAVRFVMKPVWLVAIGSLEGVLLFGKRLWIFWQSHSQLQGQNAVLSPGTVTPVLGDKNASLFILPEQVTNFERRGVSSLLWRSLYVMLVLLDTVSSQHKATHSPVSIKWREKLQYSCSVSLQLHCIYTRAAVTCRLMNKKLMYW